MSNTLFHLLELHLPIFFSLTFHLYYKGKVLLSPYINLLYTYSYDNK